MKKAQGVIRAAREWFSDHIFQRLLKNAGWLMAGSALAALLGLASLALMSRALEPSGLGLVVLITTYVQLMDRLLNFQSWQAIVKFGAHAQQQGDTAELARLVKLGSLLDVGTALIGTLVALALAPWAGPWLGLSGQETNWLILYCLVIAFNLTGVPTGILRLTDRFHFLSLHRIAVAATTLAGVAAAFLLDAGVPAMLLASAIGQLAGNLLLVLVGWRTLQELGLSTATVFGSPIQRSRERDRDILSFVVFTNVESSVKIIRDVDVFIISALLDRDAVGIYRVARRLADIANMFVEPFFFAAFPSFNKLFASKDWAGFNRLVVRSSLVVGGAVLLGWILFILTGHLIIDTLLGAAFAPAYPVTVICMLAMVIWAFAQPFSPALYSTKGYRDVFKIHLGTSVLYMLILPLLVHGSGLTGAAWAYTVFYFAWSALMLAALVKRLKIGE